MTFLLKRSPSTPLGTFGQLFMNGKQVAVTAELPWKDNHPQTSCIPVGIYKVIPHNSPKHPDTWKITGVPGRSEILLHNGNVPVPYVDSNGKHHEESLGCILVGDTYGTINGHPAVINSVTTLNKLREILPDTFMLTVQ